MVKIIHIADLHIQSARRQEYYDVFDAFIDDVERIAPAFVVIAGDIFDNKITVKPDEILIFSYLIKCLATLGVHVIIIPGNHDCNMNDSTATDLITPIIDEAIKDNEKYRDKISYYARSGTRVHLINQDNQEKIAFCVFSPLDRGVAEPDANAINIALFHETLVNSRLPNGIAIERANRDCATFDAFHMALGGDIHKMQFLRDNMAYSGSLIQQNIGESPDDHGYIVWDTATCRGTFHAVPNPTGYMIKLRFANDTLLERYEHITRVKRCDVFYENCTEPYIKQIGAYVRNRFGINVSRWECADETTISDWTAAPELSEIEKTINKQIAPGHTYKLLRMEWGNLLCYDVGPHYIDFTPQRLGIFGANRAGKSSILDIMCFVLYHKSLRGNISDVINQSASAYFCNAILRCGNDTIVINKTGDRNDHTKVHITINGKNHTQPTIAQNYRYLETYVGTIDDFRNINCQLQDQPSFTSLSTNEQTKYIYNILGLDRIPILLEQARARRRALRVPERPKLVAPVRIIEHPEAVRDDILRRMGRPVAPCEPATSDIVESEYDRMCDVLILLTDIRATPGIPTVADTRELYKNYCALGVAGRTVATYDKSDLSPPTTVAPATFDNDARLAMLPAPEPGDRVALARQLMTLLQLDINPNCISCKNNQRYADASYVANHNRLINHKIDAAEANMLCEQRASAQRYAEYVVARARSADAIYTELARTKYYYDKKCTEYERARAYTAYQRQREDADELAIAEANIAYQRDLQKSEEYERVLIEIRDADAYIANLEKYPTKIIASGVARIQRIIDETTALVTTDKITIGTDFAIRCNGVGIQRCSGFQKAIANLSIRIAMLHLTTKGHQKMTLIIDEGIVGCCDNAHLQNFIKILLPALPIKLIMISHNEEIKAAMTDSIVCVRGRPLRAHALVCKRCNARFDLYNAYANHTC